MKQKKTITESQLREMIAECVINALNEGIGWDAMKNAYKDGRRGGMDDDFPVKDFIRNGYGEVDYDDFKMFKNRYNHSKNEWDKQDAANDAVSSRPGIIGKGQRAAAVAAGKVGRGVRRGVNKATDFVHNQIGLEEGELRLQKLINETIKKVLNGESL